MALRVAHSDEDSVARGNGITSLDRMFNGAVPLAQLFIGHYTSERLCLRAEVRVMLRLLRRAAMRRLQNHDRQGSW